MRDFGPKRGLSNAIPNGGGMVIQWCRDDVGSFFNREISRQTMAPSDDIYTLILIDAATKYFRPNFVH